MEEKMRSIADRMAEIVVKINRLEGEKKAKVKEYTEQIRSEEQILFSLAYHYQRLENGEDELPFPDTGVPSEGEPVPVTPVGEA